MGRCALARLHWTCYDGMGVELPCVWLANIARPAVQLTLPKEDPGVGLAVSSGYAWAGFRTCCCLPG